jgi:hypothetical protein
MQPEFSIFEEALRYNLGFKFGKLTLKEFNMSRTCKYPQGRMIRKTTITEIARDGVLIKRYVKKGSINVF